MSCRLLQDLAEKLRHEDRENGRGRKWRTNYNKLNAQLLSLENDHHALELVHPQVRTVRLPLHNRQYTKSSSAGDCPQKVYGGFSTTAGHVYTHLMSH